MKYKKALLILIGSVAVCLIIGMVLFFATGMMKKDFVIEFSKDSGFYESEIKLTLKANRKGAVIYYTTDGSVPTFDSKKYDGAISIYDRSLEPNVLAAKTGTSFFGDYIPSEPVEKATVVRAFAQFKDGTQSKVFTKTYFIGEKICEKYKEIPVISLSINPDDFYGNENGIYIRGKVYDDWIANGGDEVNTPTWEMPANFTQKGIEWERPVHFELFENEKSACVSEDLGVRILGGASRAVEQKSLKFFARKDYGNGSVDYELFPGNKKSVDETTPLNTYDTFAVRNGGNDNWQTKFRNRYIQLLVKDRAFSTQETRPVIVFINGEYWGIYTMQDDYSDNYIYRNYDIDKNNVVIIKLGTIEEGTNADQKLYDNLISFAEDNDLSDDSKYQEICEMLDINSFIDYFCTQIYIANGDWLVHDNNYRLWRSRTTSNKPYEDGKWRYMLYDTEYSMGIYTKGEDYDLNSLKDALTFPADCPGTQVTLFSSLLKNKSFQEQFTKTFMDLVNENFNTERMNTLLEQMVQEYEPYMEDYYIRFGTTLPAEATGVTNSPMDAFNNGVEELKVFINNRNAYVPDMLKETLGLQGDAVDVSINVNDASAGSVTINTITPDLTDGAFTGKYFEDYPITITAKAKNGYTFTGWSGDSSSTEESITVTPGEVKQLEAQFKKN